jgi:hypothetical protein
MRAFERSEAVEFEPNVCGDWGSDGQTIVRRCPTITGLAWWPRWVGSDRATKVFPSQKEAVTFARGIARRQGDTLYIHGRDGSVQRKAIFPSSEPRRKTAKR